MQRRALRTEPRGLHVPLWGGGLDGSITTGRASRLSPPSLGMFKSAGLLFWGRREKH